MERNDNATRLRILDAALRFFANHGYAGTSVQDIVSAARVTKPVLYYYFQSKAGLFQALIDSVHDERFRLMQEAAARAGTLDGQLEEILTALFDYLRNHREVMRLAFASTFAAPGEIPKEVRYLGKCRRNFEFVHTLLKCGQTDGLLDRKFDSLELAFGIYGLMNIHVMSEMVEPTNSLDRAKARRIVRLFLAGAAAKKRLANR
ncbi:MAG: TetR/AcrR family transcriptional regulator [Verrucomicrobia bacterium]|nr:TetR/AcrR family transcriptional regulator [Verrucomicrobiota bacterium]